MTRAELVATLRRVAEEMGGLKSGRMSLVIPLDFPAALNAAADIIQAIPVSPSVALHDLIGRESYLKLGEIGRRQDDSAAIVDVLKALIDDDYAKMLVYRAGLARKMRGTKTVKAMAHRMGVGLSVIRDHESGKFPVSDSYLSDLRAAARKKR